MTRTVPPIQAKPEGFNVDFVMPCTDRPGERRRANDCRSPGRVEDILVIWPALSDLRTEPVDTAKKVAEVTGPCDTMRNVAQKKLPMLAALGSVGIEGGIAGLTANMAGLTNLLDVFGGMPGLEP